MRRILLIVASIAVTAATVRAEDAPSSVRGLNYPTAKHGSAYPGSPHTQSPEQQSIPLQARPEGHASARSTLKMTCSGNLTNTREDGVTLGQCDLNFLPVKQMTEIEKICGIPGTVDTPAENQCRLRAVISPAPSPAADHGNLYRVLEVWWVDKR
jgi:hypothetical protein